MYKRTYYEIKSETDITNEFATPSVDVCEEEEKDIKVKQSYANHYKTMNEMNFKSGNGSSNIVADEKKEKEGEGAEGGTGEINAEEVGNEEVAEISLPMENSPDTVKQLMPKDNDGTQVILHIHLNAETMRTALVNTRT